jgi:hypothetical protein
VLRPAELSKPVGEGRLSQSVQLTFVTSAHIRGPAFARRLSAPAAPARAARQAQLNAIEAHARSAEAHERAAPRV